MSHFAKVENGIVTEVLVIEQDVIDTGLFGDPSSFIQCSYNTAGGVYYEPNTSPRVPAEDQSKALRKNFPAIGWTYDFQLDAFYGPQPFPSWSLNTTTCLWDPPTPNPTDGTNAYAWDENTLSWVLL
jgi:hypothetical protein